MEGKSQPVIEVTKVTPRYYAQTCPNCNGRGTVSYERRPCPTCGTSNTPGIIFVPTGEGMDGRRDYENR